MALFPSSCVGARQLLWEVLAYVCIIYGDLDVGKGEGGGLEKRMGGDEYCTCFSLSLDCMH